MCVCVFWKRKKTLPLQHIRPYVVTRRDTLVVSPIASSDNSISQQTKSPVHDLPKQVLHVGPPESQEHSSTKRYAHHCEHHNKPGDVPPDNPRKRLRVEPCSSNEEQTIGSFSMKAVVLSKVLHCV